MTLRDWAVVFLLALTPSLALAEGVQSEPQTLANFSEPIAVSKVTSTITRGTPWLIVSGGLFCVPTATIGWNVAPYPVNMDKWAGYIRKGMKSVGFRIASDPDSPFPDQDTPNFLLGAIITGVKGTACAILNNQKGAIDMNIQWQIYSSSERKVVFTLDTVGHGQSPDARPDGFLTAMTMAIDQNTQALVASDSFKQFVGQHSADAKSALSGPTGKLSLAGSLSAKSVKISDAIGAVVLVESGGGHGSGVLVSSDGYVLTDRHVVGEEKFVKIRWSDGLEGLGEVIRTDKRRDVALVKTDPRGRQPLALQAQTPDAGSTIFAIGAPEDPKLQSTVTRGVISSTNRIINGFSFIQSDVTVNPGNSGGPLLNEKGEVLGLTDLKLQTPDGATGLNFFTPIGDALAFLSLEQH